ncbi:hypothetical protein MMC34_002231 [Xylographa carneopallida]|nr:hypothetical protein [Xylographa carneopallida]
MPDHSLIPLPYRILLLYLEPVAAFNGAILSHFFPAYYLAGMSPSATTTTYSSPSQVIFDQLAACYFLFAFNEAVVLRSTSDLRVWKAIVLGILICDLFHLYGTWEALGAAFWDPRLWRVEDWVNLAMLYGPGGMRLAFLIGVGLKEEKASTTARKEL